MRIYIGNNMYDIEKETVIAAKKLSFKILESTKEMCETSEGGLYLYLATLAMLKMISERTLLGLSEETLEKMFGETDQNT